jgi:predicted nucleic acid-binding protein
LKTIDASALINLLAFPENFEVHRESFEDYLIAPAILIPEFLNGVRKLLIRKEIPTDHAKFMISEFDDLRVELLTLTDDRTELWSMAQNMTPYDAAYVLISHKTKSPLVTSDARLARSATQSTDVILLE